MVCPRTIKVRSVEYERNAYLFKSYKNWILHGMVRDAAVAANLSIDCHFIAQTKREFCCDLDALKFYLNLPIKENSLFINHSVFQYALNNYRFNREGSRVFFTHSDTKSVDRVKLSRDLNQARTVFTYNTKDADFLKDIGVNRSEVRTIYGAVDRSVFFPSTNWINKKDFVIFVGDCKARKKPDLIYSVIQKMQDTRFVIHGRGWKTFLNQLPTLSNLQYLEFKKSRHPELMREASLFVSLSSLEGGPFPTIEALASGTPVVATDTGWNKELIKDKCGIVLRINPSVIEVESAIRSLLNQKIYTWDKDLLNGKLTWGEAAKHYFDIKE